METAGPKANHVRNLCSYPGKNDLTPSLGKQKRPRGAFDTVIQPATSTTRSQGLISLASYELDQAGR